MVALAGLIGCGGMGVAAATEYSFGIAPVHSAFLSAEYWNPILDYVRHKSGVALHLVVPRSGPESTSRASQGEFDFVYSNHLFKPQVLPQKYQVILQPRDETMYGQIVVLESSDIRSLADLRNRTVGFPSKASFAGYAVTFDHLQRESIPVNPVFGGTQEGIMAQLKTGRVDAIGVLSNYMRDWAARERVHYRVLWQSEPFKTLPIAYHPRVPRSVWKPVQEAFAGMQEDPEGVRVLEKSARAIGQSPPLGFVKATNANYENYLQFYKTTKVRDIE